MRFKAIHNKHNSIQLDLAMIDRYHRRYVMNTHAMFYYSGPVPLGGPGEENKDFAWLPNPHSPDPVEYINGCHHQSHVLVRSLQ